MNLDFSYPGCKIVGTRESGALFSEDEVYRYCLWRHWDFLLPPLVFGLLNPSTADAFKPDPTMTRCRGYAETFGYGGLVIINEFAYRATKIKDMKAASDPVGPLNDRVIAKVVSQLPDIVLGWGTHGSFCKRDVTMRQLLKKAGAQAHTLHLTQNGFPGHPLYLKASCPLTSFVL